MWASNELLQHLPGAERRLRSKGIQAIGEPIVPGIFGDARVDGLLNEWFKAYRQRGIRNTDPETEHELHDLLAQLGVGDRPCKGRRPLGRR